MLERDLKTYIELGRALWSDPERAHPYVVETLSAVSLLDLPEDKTLERASSVMLNQAMRQGSATQTRQNLESGHFQHPFFRLLAAERFILSALHQGRWSYARLSRVMGLPPEKIEAVAWKARAEIGADRGVVALGVKLAGPNCPEYDLDRPWTQRFLDEEMPTGRERVFLQNHLMACDSCRQALNRTRDLYYAVEKILPQPTGNESALISDLRAVRRKGLRLRRRASETTIAEGFVALIRQRDFQVFLGIVLIALLWRAFHY